MTYPITATTPAANAATSPPSASLGGLDSQAFLKLLVAQLRYQDPMAPADSAAMLQQTAQFSQVEALQGIASVQQQLMGLQQVTVASGLIGKDVSAITADGRTIEGTVEGIRFTADGPALRVGEDLVPLDRATEIHRRS